MSGLVLSYLHDEILKKMSKSEKKFLTTTKQFLGPLSSSERSKIIYLVDQIFNQILYSYRDIKIYQSKN
jgi:hypothetical protein